MHQSNHKRPHFMRNYNRYIPLCCLLFLLFATSMTAQDKQDLGTEVVNVVKPYTPELGDAFKVKATPVLNDSINTVKKPVSYTISSVPVASTFVPQKGRATKIETGERLKLYDNYLSLGFGNFINIDADYFTSYEISRDKSFGAHLAHNSSQGGIEDVVLDDHYYDTDINLNYVVRDRIKDWRGDLDIIHKAYNWYGVDEFTTLDEQALMNIEPQHSYFGAMAGGQVNLFKSAIEKGSLNVGYFGDSYSSGELRTYAKANGSFDLADEKLDLGVKIDYLSGGFDRNYENSQEIKYSHLITDFSPGITIIRDNLSVKLGIKTGMAFDLQGSNSEFFLYPDILASYRVIDDYFIAYGGIDGEIKQTSYQDLVTENPYVSPTLMILPTKEKYDAFIGAKGKLNSSLSFNLRGSYGQSMRPLFKNNYRFQDLSGATVNENYQYGNSFGVVYDDVNTFSGFGELTFEVNSEFQLHANAEVFSYSTDVEAEAWNLPSFKSSIYGDYQITEKWFAGVDLFFIGSRMDEIDVQGLNLQNQNQIVSLDSYFDANVNVGFRLNDELSFFIQGSNLLNNDYQRWVNYKVQGLQVLAGAAYKFDWK